MATISSGTNPTVQDILKAFGINIPHLVNAKIDISIDSPVTVYAEFYADIQNPVLTKKTYYLTEVPIKEPKIITLLIDLDSIEKNPDYPNGGFKKYSPGKWNISFTCKQMPAYFVNNSNIHIISINQEKEKISGFIIDSELISEEIVQSLQEDASETGLTLTWNREMTEISTKYEDKYFYEYENIEIECNHCKAKILVKDIMNDKTDGDFVNTCPNCGEDNCIEEEIIYETIEQALLRIDNNVLQEIKPSEILRQEAAEAIEIQNRVIENVLNVDLNKIKINEKNDSNKHQEGFDGC